MIDYLGSTRRIGGNEERWFHKEEKKNYTAQCVNSRSFNFYKTSSVSFCESCYARATWNPRASGTGFLRWLHGEILSTCVREADDWS